MPLPGDSGRMTGYAEVIQMSDRTVVASEEARLRASLRPPPKLMASITLDVLASTSQRALLVSARGGCSGYAVGLAPIFSNQRCCS
jgi:hypothetical protein